MSAASPVRLCPQQQEAFDGLMVGLKSGSIFRLWGGTGRGKTTVLREVHRQAGGAFLDMRDVVNASVSQHPLALEETLYDLVMETLKAHDLVVMDDFHLIDLAQGGCHFYPRSGFLNAAAMGLCLHALHAGKKLVFGTSGQVTDAIGQRSYDFGIDKFKPADYAALTRNWLGDGAGDALDFEKIHRFAPNLNAHQLKAACLWLKKEPSITTETFIEYLRSQRLASNVDLGEVQAVDLKDLKGVDDVLRQLEIHIALPLENDAMVNELKLRPKRGVLLYGPPGTGKTTIGRALAHRLKSKFFLIDGTFISGTAEFYTRVHRVFEAAKENAPSIIFIDDADAIFESREEQGLYRYLLTMLDGLESESAGRVCVMMTAMNVGHLPPALVRSGRVELWLEMKLPDAAARETILQDFVRDLPPPLNQANAAVLSVAAEGFTGADLKRTIEDGKSLFAFDKSKGAPLGETDEYFLQAMDGVRENKSRYAEAEAQALMHGMKSPTGFPSFSSFGPGFSSVFTTVLGRPGEE
jgi:transitional endoplasmic reticulum ATPase